MDPRTSAKVTAPDLVKAFTEGTGREPEDSGTEQRIWIAYGSNNDVQYADFPMSSQGMMQALALTKDFLSREGSTVILVVAAERPESFQASISAADG